MKQALNKLDIYRNIVQTILITVPLLTGIGTGAVFLLKAVYAEEIHAVEHMMEFAEEAQTILLPAAEAQHIVFDDRITDLELKHDGGFSIGIRYDFGLAKLIMRGIDLDSREKWEQELNTWPQDGSNKAGNWYYINPKTGYIIWLPWLKI